jgi:hypothetical protein
MPLTKIQSLGITDGTIVNADINASAAIAGSKLSGAGISQADQWRLTAASNWRSSSSICKCLNELLQMVIGSYWNWYDTIFWNNYISIYWCVEHRVLILVLLTTGSTRQSRADIMTTTHNSSNKCSCLF